MRPAKFALWLLLAKNLRAVPLEHVSEHEALFRNLKRLLKDEVPRYQKLGSFDEHLITLNSQVYGDPYIYEDAYLIYHDPMSKTLWLTLFELNSDKVSADRLGCFTRSIAEFQPNRILTSSPEKLDSRIGEYQCTNEFFDKDYQIRLDKFDEQLHGGAYEDLRYRVKNAVKRGYQMTLSRDLTPAHSYVCASHISKRDYNLWDYQLFLRLGNYVMNSPEVKLFNVLLDGVLIAFDVVDFLGNTMATPIGFYLDYPSLADFLMHREIQYAKERKYEWLDIGWACNAGLEEFKKKWKGIPKFNIWVQEYRK